MKKIVLILASLMASGAFAQGLTAVNKGSAPKAVEVLQEQPVQQLEAAAVDKPKAPSQQALDYADRYNPFTGGSVTVEGQQLQVEKAKYHTQLLEELLRAATLSEDLKNLPLKKRAEIAHQLGGDASRLLESLNGATEVKKKEEKPVVVAAPKKKPTPVVTTPPAPAVPNVVSVISSGASKSVILESNGSTIIAKQGDSTPFGVVSNVSDSEAVVGGKVLKVRKAVVARFAVTDPKVETSADGKAIKPTVTTGVGSPLPPPLPALESIKATPPESAPALKQGSTVPASALTNPPLIVKGSGNLVSQ